MIYRPLASLVAKILRFLAGRVIILSLLGSIFIFLAAIFCFSKSFHVWSSIKLLFQTTTIIEKNYTNPQPADFRQCDTAGKPLEKSGKANLILIVSESLEDTYSNTELFGEDLLSELTSLKQNGDSIKDLWMVLGCHYTLASLYSMQYGLPLLYFQCIGGSPTQGNLFAKNCTSIFDVMHANGYHILHLQGATLKFSDKASLFSHLNNVRCLGSDEISLEEYPSRQPWGLWDSDLFDKARKELAEMSGKGNPFALSIETVDTHIGNHLQPGQEARFGDFRDILRLQSRLIADFVKWVEEQPFGENTVIVILGDHCNMEHQAGAIALPQAEIADRPVFNCVLHSQAGVKLKDRPAAMFDFAPTILDALGFSWPSYSLGIGRSLYRETPTILEKDGLEHWNLESAKRSKLYKKLILE